MSVLNSKARNAIVAAINSKVDLDAALAMQLSGTSSKERDAILFEIAHLVAATYTSMSQSPTIVEAYASRKGNGITFGSLMDDGSHKQTPEADAARKWFSRNILNAGFLSFKKDAPSKSKAERLAAQYDKMDGKERATFRRLIGF